MSIFQIIAVFFAILMMYVVRVHQRKIKFNLLESSFWYSLWLIFIAIAIFPQLLIGISQTFQFARVFDLLLVMALMVLTTIVIISYFTQKENQKKLEDFVRKEAIKTAKK